MLERHVCVCVRARARVCVCVISRGAETHTHTQRERERKQKEKGGCPVTAASELAAIPPAATLAPPRRRANCKLRGLKCAREVCWCGRRGGAGGAGRAGVGNVVHPRGMGCVAGTPCPESAATLAHITLVLARRARAHTRAHTHTRTYAHTHTRTHRTHAHAHTAVLRHRKEYSKDIPTCRTVTGMVRPHASHVCVMPSFTARTPARCVSCVHSVSLCSLQSAG